MKNIKLCSGYGKHHSPNNKTQPKDLVSITWDEIKNLVDHPQEVDKSEAQWLIPSTLLSRQASEQRASGVYWTLWLDLDVEPPALEEIAKSVSGLIDDCDYEAYTTRSATEYCQKSRVLIPLEQGISAQQWVDCQRLLNDDIEICTAEPDRVNEKPSQLCFLPNKGEHYHSISNRTGKYFNPLVSFKDSLKKLQSERKAATKMLDLQKAISEKKRLDRTNSGQQSPIDWFNTNHGMADLLLEHGYTQHDENSFTSPYSSSGSRSANIDPQTGRLNSLSSSDPLFSDGGGAHDVFSVYTVLTHNGNATESWRAVSEMMDSAVVAAEDPYKAALSPMDKLSSFSITGITHELRLQMLDDVYVLKDLAILGQWSVFYASPNTGKTLLTLWLLREQIQAGELSPERIFYINADDAFKGAVEKAELAKELGYQMLVPGINGFSTKEVLPLMSALVEHNQTKGAVIILDTLKKFTDLMEKKAASEFGKIARMFVASGGTLICLAHTNKHKDHDGKSVYTGTADIVDDADCVYVIEGGETNGAKLAEFRNIKARGDVKLAVSFKYDKEAGSYEQLIDSITRVDSAARDNLAAEATLKKAIELDSEVTSTILGFIHEDGVTKTELVKLVTDDTGQSRRKIIRVLEEWCGTDYWKGHRWVCKTEDKNAKVYYPLKCPLLIGRE
jgi:archaellum biogenesis ATPase FlaH